MRLKSLTNLNLLEIEKKMFQYGHYFQYDQNDIKNQQALQLFLQVPK